MKGGGRPLSIRDAAEDVGERAFLIEPDGTCIGYRQAAARADAIVEGLLEAVSSFSDRGRFLPIVARARADDILAVLGLLDRAEPFVLVHPALGPIERRAIAQRHRLSEPVALGPPDQASDCGRKTPIAARLSSQPSDGSAAAFVTSGTTGQPKVVVHTFGSLTAAARASEDNLGWNADDRWLLSIPIAHIGGFSIVSRCLAARRTVVIAESGGTEAFIDAVQRHRVTLASLVPTQLIRLLDRRPRWRPPGHLRAVLLGGAPAAAALVERAREAGYPVLKTYGLTEAGSQVATERLGGSPAASRAVGPPLADVDVRIDGERILIRGPMLMRGFLDGGREGFEADGWYDTGDRGRRSETGELEVWGRGAELIISGGENVHPAEVEAVLESLEGVQHALVYGDEDPEWGQAVKAAIVFRPEGRLPWTSLDEAVRLRLAPYKRPRSWVELPAFHRLPSGKVDRPSVRRAARDLSSSSIVPWK